MSIFRHVEGTDITYLNGFMGNPTLNLEENPPTRGNYYPHLTISHKRLENRENQIPNLLFRIILQFIVLK